MSHDARTMLARLQAEYGVDPMRYPTRHARGDCTTDNPVQAPALILALGYPVAWSEQPREPRQLTPVQVFGKYCQLDIFEPRTVPMAAVR